MVRPRADAEEAPQGLLEAERSVLAACILGADAIVQASRILQPATFYWTSHQATFRAILALHAQESAVDLVTLTSQLRRDETLDTVGGPVFLAQLMDSATTTANTESHARIVASQHARRESRRVLRALEANTLNGAPLGASVSSAIAALAQIQALEDPTRTRPPSLAEQVLTDETIQTATLTAASDLIGSRYIVEGGMTIIVGHSGLGKTWLALQMLRSIATGTPWLGHHAVQGRCGMLELEMPAWSIRERLGTSYGGHIDILAMPQGFTHVTDPDMLAQLIQWVKSRHLKMLGLDPVHALHNVNENKGDELAPFMACLMRLRQETGVHIVLIHHVNKLEFDKDLGLQTSVLRSVRGSGRLANDPDNVLGLIRYHGRILLVNAKTRLGPQPASLTIRQLDRSAAPGEQGFFELAMSEQEQQDLNELKVRKALGFYDGITMDKLVELTELSDRTVRRYLQEIGALRVRDPEDTRTVLWYPADAAAAQTDFAQPGD